MKKYFISISKLAAATIVAFTLAACGEEVQIQENPNVKKVTKFSSGNNGTRTSIDNERHFYWYPNDQIWVDVDGNGTFTAMSDYSQISADNKSADFYVTGRELTAPSYNILYTGNGSTSPTTVTIPATRSYSSWNDKMAFGKSGDCGTATATRGSDGNYTFQLKHQAAYIVISPIFYILGELYSATLGSVEIISENSTIAGTYPFSMSGLDTQNVTDGSNTITISYSGNVFGMMAGQQNLFMPIVIQPGYHKLTIVYSFRNGQTFTYHIAAREYKPNSSTNFNQTFAPTFYQWDAPVSQPAYLEGDNYNTTTDATAASQSCRTMPNANEMGWYIYNGDIRWDTTTPWAYGTSDLNYGGIWVKKKSVILADNTLLKCGNAAHNGNGPTFCSEHAPRGSFIDGRTNAFAMGNHEPYVPNSIVSHHKGKPDASVIDNYFFLPAAGYIDENGHPQAVGEVGYFWASTPMPGAATIAYCFAFAQNNAAIGNQTYGGRSRRYAVAPNMFK